ncbi:hypothetical protein ACEWY4_001712 [Coilia grayii]|uniref:Gypsy retrotransposon integrase-like protein 1 n=1 Tax=Coilia grayii TaxID=363190 RepID=A0ABD1KTR5_9TELE
MFDLDEFVRAPTQEGLLSLTRDELLRVAGHYKVEVRGGIPKAELQVQLIDALHRDGIFGEVDKVIPEHPASPTKSSLEWKRLALREKELECEQAKMQREYELRVKELEHAHVLRIKELELQARQAGVPARVDFDVARNIRVVPPFNEKEVDKFFNHFERVATTLKWPGHVWTMVLQCVFTGKAQEAYSSLPLQDASDYEKVKKAVLRIYSLVPEAYRQKYRSFLKSDSLTYVEFVREKELLFDRWLQAEKVTTFDALRNLMIVEDFTNNLPQGIATHVSEHKDLTPTKAAELADEYALAHRRDFTGKNSASKSSGLKPAFSRSRTPSPPQDKFRNKPSSKPPVKLCVYCKKKGHVMAECYRFKRKDQTHPANPGKTETGLCVSNLKVDEIKQSKSKAVKPIANRSFAPFILDGTVALPGVPGEPTPIKILRDTGASQSFVLRNVLPFSDSTQTGDSVLVRGIEMGFVDVPLHKVSLSSDLVTGNVVVGVRPSLPVEGVAMLLGNDLAGGKVLPCPIVSPVSSGLDVKMSMDLPEVFPSSVVTRAMAQRFKNDTPDDVIDLSDTFLASPSADGVQLSCVPPSVSAKLPLNREQLIKEQTDDSSLTPLFSQVMSKSEVDSSPQGYFVQDGVLMRKWRPLTAPAHDWHVVNQIVVPTALREEILSLAHDHHFAGHLGVKKTADRVMHNFYWPGIMRDVAKFCKTCHLCQVVGKPNQVIPPAPLQPIPVSSEPFAHVILDCVGPLPKTKTGNQYLLTIMCSLTRFPEAIPLRKITAPVVVKALLNFFSMFGLPKMVQTDQGTNFMSKVFKQVMQQLAIQHVTSSSYHPQSQGALERFHQTLKNMLKTYCLEFQRDWDEGVPMAQFAIREVVQESLGFSPAELVFGHSVRGPLKIVRDAWLTDSTRYHDLSDYVSKMRYRLQRACQLAKQNLKVSQGKMKKRYDRKAISRHFSPGDQVMVLLPVLGSALQARYAGPYRIKRRVGELNYVIATPDRRKVTRLCHINRLKPYCTRPAQSDTPVSFFKDGDSELSTASSAETATVAPCAVTVFSDTPPDVPSPSVEVVEGRLKNSEILNDLPAYLSHLSESEASDLTALFKSHRDLFSDIPRCTNAIVHDIEVEGAKPIRQHPYRANPLKRAILKQEVNFMLENNIAETSNSPWSSPCLLVPKPDGTFRFCTDFRRVNTVTKPDSHPLPRMDDCVDRLGTASHVSKLDLLKGYWQVPLSDRAKEISAFVTPDHFLQYVCMPFGLRNAPATFQRLMNNVLNGVRNCEAFLDDVIVYSATWRSHMEDLATVFDRLSKASLTVNLAKCVFGQATVVYLGKVVGRGEVRPVHSKVEAILTFPAPTSRRELRRFLGMVGYYRSSCKNFSTVAAPLTDMLSTKRVFKWGEACQAAFEAVKALLTTAPVLAAPNLDMPFSIAVDASDLGAGAVLFQAGKDGLDHPVAFFSRKFNSYQRAYSTIEKEALALVLALQHFEVYVGGAATVTVFTDHNPLTFLNRMCNSNQRLMRWSLVLQGYNIDIKHIRGCDNVVADALSRV